MNLTMALAVVAIVGIFAVLLIAEWIDTRHRLNAILHEYEPSRITPDDIEALTIEAEQRIGKVS